MFKRACLVLVMTLALSGVCVAADIDFSDYINMIPTAMDKIPEIREGVGYDFINDQIDSLHTFIIKDLKYCNLEAGYATPFNEFANNNKAVIAVSKRLIDLGSEGVEIPILNKFKCDIAAYASWSRVSLGLGNGKEGNEFGAGAAALGILEWKF